MGAGGTSDTAPTIRRRALPSGEAVGVIPEADPPHVQRSLRRRVFRGVVEVLITGVALYYVLPKVLDAFSVFPKLSTVGVPWIAVVVACEAASFFMVWILLRLATRTTEWLSIATSQLAGNALSSIVPAGAAAGATLQVRMLGEAGVDTATAASGMTVFTILQFTTVAALPVLLLPAVLAGGMDLGPALSDAVVIGVIAFVAVVAIGLTLAVFDAPLRGVGRMVQAVRNRLRRGREPLTGLPDGLVHERNEMLQTLGEHWRRAVLASVGRVAFDYLALLAAVAAVGAHPHPQLIVLAYVTAVVLALIPITPGGLGFVEAGLTGALTLAGVDASHAVLATLLYRLAEYWLPLLAGPPAYVVFRVSHRRARKQPRV